VAQQTITIYTDDIDGRPIRDGKGGTVGFSLDGMDYEMAFREAPAGAREGFGALHGEWSED
jgi:hypothetical protein